MGKATRRYSPKLKFQVLVLTEPFPMGYNEAWIDHVAFPQVVGGR